MRARYYSPEFGRFISRDPIGQQDDINLYIYAGNNPVMFVDVWGKCKKDIIQIFRNAKKDADEIINSRDGGPISWWLWPTDSNPIILLKYFNLEYQGTTSAFFGINIVGEGKYDLVMGAKGGLSIFKKYTEYGYKYFEFNGKLINIGEISNVLAGLNASRVGISQDTLKERAMETVEGGGGNSVEGEFADQILYKYGYYLGEIEEEQGHLKDEQIVNAIEMAVRERKYYNLDK